ncbi:unnamed protein product [Phytomonas sp. Hart1]|nr:unnamed protein product [Phytomonas sp. Hart1]|eukprot:CCW66008.1 unnamed protein product [Phytomonas sp. isolate Hart1]
MPSKVLAVVVQEPPKVQLPRGRHVEDPGKAMNRASIAVEGLRFAEVERSFAWDELLACGLRANCYHRVHQALGFGAFDKDVLKRGGKGG